MSLLVSLDSTFRQSPSELSSNFNTSFNPALALYKKEGYQWACALVRLEMWYSFFNLSAVNYQNTQFQVNWGAGNTLITITDGVYNIYDLSNAMNAAIVAAGAPAGTYVSLIPNFNLLKIALQVEAGTTIDLLPGTSDFYKLLGFDLAQASVAYVGPLTTLGNLPGDITNGVDNIQVLCSIVRGSYSSGKSGRVLFTFTPNAAPGSNIAIVPVAPLYTPVELSNDAIRDIKITLQDNRGRIVDLNNQNLQVLLHLKLIEV